MFGFFLITIGVAYYDKDAKRHVGWYSIIFSLISLLFLVTHILQQYYFGLVGEKAMMNLRKALFSGRICSKLKTCSLLCISEQEKSFSNHEFLLPFLDKLLEIIPEYLVVGILCNELSWFEKPKNSIGSVTSHVISDTSMVKIIISKRMSVIVQCISSILIATVVTWSRTGAWHWWPGP